MNGHHRATQLAFFIAISAALYVQPGTAQTADPGATPPVAMARVLGRDIPAEEKAQLTVRILIPLLDQFARENGIQASEAEIDAYSQWLDRIQKQLETRQEERRKKLESELTAGNLSEADRQQKEAQVAQLKKNEEAFDKEARKGQEEAIRQALRKMAQSQVRRWMIFKALHDRYGGRVAFQQAGPEPVEALRDFLKEKKEAGAFQIQDPEEAARFWRYFTDPSVHHFFPEAEGKQAINTPLWRMEKPLGQ